MKKLYTLLLGCIFTATFTNCNDFLDYTPTAVVDGKEIDLLGLRRHLEWMFGRPMPKAEDMKKPEGEAPAEPTKVN